MPGSGRAGGSGRAAGRGPADRPDSAAGRDPAAGRGPAAGRRPAPESPGELPGTILQAGRRKAYRPLDVEARRAALQAGLGAYARGDYFEAHELLEPAWMGTADLAERALYQGLIKLSAAYVHRVRGNPLGMIRNLEGARGHLETSGQIDPAQAEAAGIDLAVLLAAIDQRLAVLRSLPAVPRREPGSPRFPTYDPVPGVPEAPALPTP